MVFRPEYREEFENKYRPMPYISNSTHCILKERKKNSFPSPTFSEFLIWRNSYILICQWYLLWVVRWYLHLCSSKNLKSGKVFFFFVLEFVRNFFVTVSKIDFIVVSSRYSSINNIAFAALLVITLFIKKFILFWKSINVGNIYKMHWKRIWIFFNLKIKYEVTKIQCTVEFRSSDLHLSEITSFWRFKIIIKEKKKLSIK